MTDAATESSSFRPRLMSITPSSWPHKEMGAILDLAVGEPDAMLALAAFPKLQRLGQAREYEGMPCLAIDRARKKVYFDTSDPGKVEAELTTFYEHFLADDVDHFAISPEASPGLYEIFDRLRDCDWHGRYIMLTFNGPVRY